MELFIEYGIYGHTFLLPPQEDVLNDIIGRTFILLPQEYSHKFLVCIVIIIGDHGTKVAQ